MEIWVDIEGYEGMYQISSYGNVRSLDREVHGGYAGTYIRKGAAKALTPDFDGYLSVSLHKDGKDKVFRVHRLVASAFIPNPDNKLEVNHKDLDKTNNHVDNLEWVTRSENEKHAYATGAAKPHAKLAYSRSISIAKRSIPVYCVETNTTYPSMAAAGRATNTDIELVRQSILHGRTVHSQRAGVPDSGYTYRRVNNANN